MHRVKTGLNVAGQAKAFKIINIIYNIKVVHEIDETDSVFDPTKNITSMFELKW